MRFAAVLLLVLTLVAAAYAQPAPPVVAVEENGPLSVRLEVSSSEPELGAVVTLSLEATLAGDAPGAPSPGTVHWPDLHELLTQSLGEEVVEVEPGGRSTTPRSATIAFRLFDAGSFELPPLPVEATLPGTEERPRVTLEGVTLRVPSVLENTEEAAPLPSRDTLVWEPPFEVPRAEWFVAGAAVLALAGLVWWLLRRRGPQTVERAAAPPAPPHERALAALEDLVSRHLPEQGAVEPYFVELSEILRRYVEDRFGLRAPERTTEEFLAEITSTERGRQAIREAHRAVLRAFLERADLVKFARAEPDVTTCHAAATTARRFVEETVPREPAAPAADRAPAEVAP